MEFSLQAALSPGRLKPELQTKSPSVQVWSSGMEFSLQAALSPGRLKPELRTKSPSVQVGVQVIVYRMRVRTARAPPSLRDIRHNVGDALAHPGAALGVHPAFAGRIDTQSVPRA